VQCSSSTPNFVAAQPCQHVVRAHSRLQEAGDLPQELVARGMAAGVVHDLELVEVDVNHRVAHRVVLARRFDCRVEPAFELAPVDEPGEGVVGGLVGQ
jgi:hypothetical protein